MDKELEAQLDSDNGATPEGTPAPEAGKAPDAVSVDDFRKFQASMDRKLAEREKQLNALIEENQKLKTKSIDERIEASDNPQELRELMKQKAQAEAAALQQRYAAVEAERQMADARKYFAAEYGVPDEVLNSVTRAEDMWPVALGFLKQTKAQQEEELRKLSRKAQAESAVERGETAVSKATPSGAGVGRMAMPADTVTKYKNTGKGVDFLRESREALRKE